MGVCSSQKQIRDLEKKIKNKERRLEQIKLEIQNIAELIEKYYEKGFQRQAQLTEQKIIKLCQERYQIENFLFNLPQKRRIKEQFNAPISGRKNFDDNSENSNQSLENLMLENEERLRKLSEQKDNQKKNKKIETDKQKLPEKLQYPDIDQIKFIQIKQH